MLFVFLPNSFTPTPTITATSVKLVASTTDQAATSSSGSSGISGYRFSKDGGSTWTAYQTSGTYTFTGLTPSTSYQIRVEAKDNAGNYSSYSNAMVLNIKRLYIRQLYQALRGNGGGAESEISGWENSSATTAAQLAYGIFSSDNPP